MTAQLTIGIIGAGPAGMMAALEASRRGARVLLFDTNPMVGRKLLVTGNGRCNITNVHAAPGRYACADPAFLEAAFGICGHRETVARLHELAIPTYCLPDGWCYPVSDSAAAVRQTFEAALDLAGVEVRLQTKISDLRAEGGRIVLTVGGGPNTLAVDRAIVATGGMAYPALGSKGDFFSILERLGHTVAPIRPALAPIEADVRAFHKLQGVRLDVGLSLIEGNRALGATVGNLMFTQSGFSGPAPMDLSHLVSARPGTDLTLSIDLLACTRDTLLDLIARKRSEPVPVSVILSSVMPPKIPPVVLPMAGLAADARLSGLSDAELQRLLDLLGHLTARVKGTGGFKAAQVSSGGVPVTEVDPRTMASRIVPGLHFAGEVLDVIGPCGGYSLQWAWTSGVVAGMGVAEGNLT